MWAVSLSYDMQDLEGIAEDMARAPQIIARELPKALDAGAKLILQAAQINLERHGAIASRKLFNSLTVVAQPGLRSIQATVPYAKEVEKGRPAGLPMPAKGALLGWMGIRGISPSLEFPIRRAISRRGIPARPFLLPALESTQAAVDREFVLMMHRVVRELRRPQRAQRPSLLAR